MFSKAYREQKCEKLLRVLRDACPVGTLKISWFKHLKHETCLGLHGSWSNSNGKIKRKTFAVTLGEAQGSIKRIQIPLLFFFCVSFFLPFFFCISVECFSPAEMTIQPITIVPSVARVLQCLTAVLHMTRVSCKCISCLGAPYRFLWIKQSLAAGETGIYLHPIPPARRRAANLNTA